MTPDGDLPDANDLAIPDFTTERTHAWRPVYDDGAALHRVLCDAELCRFTPSRPSPSLAATRFFIARWRSQLQEGLLTYALAERGAESVAFGVVQVDTKSGEVGALIAREAASQGYVAEAMATLLRLAGPALSGKQPFAICDAENREAIYILSKSSFRERKLLARYRIHPALSDQPRDCIRWSRPA